MAAADRLRTLIAEELPRVVEIRRDLHRHPEIMYEEVRTSGVVQRELTAAGIGFRAGLAGGTGVAAHLPGRATTATALRADMDALPIVEQSGKAWASTIPGRMHACGHDGHTAMLIGAARVLKRLSAETELPRPVTFVFQPAEEGGAGGKRMVDEGVLTGELGGAPADIIFGVHGWPELRQGEVGTRVGPLLSASDRWEIVVHGRGAHAAWPHRSADPIVCAAATVQALQTLVSRNVDPLDSAVVSVTVLEAGSAFNVIPDRAVLKGTLRTLSEATRLSLRDRIGQVAAGVAAAHGCTAAYDFRFGYPVTSNDAGAVEVFTRAAEGAFGPARTRTVERPVMGGEDFAFYGQQVPACFWVLGLIPPGAETFPPLHAPDFDFNDDALATGVEMFCRLALR
jgi:amidohydrolase